jgi:hypothetical protein
MNNELFTLPPSQPSPLQSARRALADAERDYAAERERWKENSIELEPYRRAVNRYSELVKAEELKELNNRAG